MAESIATITRDPHSTLVQTVWASIYAPAGRNRKRIPDNCVAVCPDEDSARSHAKNAGAGHYPAVVSGPSRSSEGYFLYYLIRWLD